ncbi:MAG TPA: phage holin family protein [Nannocystaceae bacterium]|nr:phage holin family protein [Nannocystaceae bacterium]
MTNPLDRRAPTMPPRPRGEIAELQEESTAQLMKSALGDVGDIVRAEIDLALVEVREDAKKVARTLPMGASGGVLALLGAVFLMHAIALALDLALPAWAAYLITATVTLGAAAALVLVARARLEDWKSFVPERTLETLQENKRWIQRKLS